MYRGISELGSVEGVTLLSSPDRLNSMLLHQGKGHCLYTNWFYSRMVSMITVWSLQGRFLWRYLWWFCGWCSGWFLRWFPWWYPWRYPWWYPCAVVQCYAKIDWSSKVNNFTSFGCSKTFLYPLESAVNSLHKSIIIWQDRYIALVLEISAFKVGYFLSGD